MKYLFMMFLVFSFNSSFALEYSDLEAIEKVIHDYTRSWNESEGVGFANGYTEDADFVNIFGTHFTGKDEIEFRHLKILQGFLKGSELTITHTQFKEVQPGLVIAIVRWKLAGFQKPNKDALPENREGIQTQVFIKISNEWKITSSQNTMIPL